jgi:subtilisin-like proprotein convertase family protein
MFFRRRRSNAKINPLRALPRLEILEARLVPAGEFSLHSLPGATKVIYLDFDGHTTTGTSWNTTNGPTIITPVYSIDAIRTTSFSTQELANIREIWERVSEDFRPFNINVTTEDPGVSGLTNTGGSDNTWGIRATIGGRSTILPVDGPGAVGIALFNSFNDNVDEPCFIFSEEYGPPFYNNTEHIKGVAETISHEVGHTLNLVHDGNLTTAYFGGHGTFQDGWAPIMGNSDNHNVTQWSIGEYQNARNWFNGPQPNTQDDLAVIASTTNGITYRNDDYGSSIANASILGITSPNIINTTGIIERTADLDFFRFNLVSGGAISININPVANGPNLNVEAKLYDANGTLITTSSPTTSLGASFTNTLQAGTYYISVDGVGNGNPLTNGYSDYGSLGLYTITGTLPAAVNNPVITGPNGGPGAATSTASIPENTTSVYGFTADRSVTWSLAGGVDQTRFTINPTTGVLAFTSAPDFENPTDSDRNNTYTVVVNATASNGFTSQQTLTVTVTDVLDVPPVITGPNGISGAATSSATINENTTNIFSFQANRAVTWSLAGGVDQARFSINPATGALAFTSAPDFENPTDSDRNNTYTVVVRASDSLGYFSTQTVTITIRDVNENPGNPTGNLSGARIISANAIGLQSGTITGFTIVFNEPVVANSFTTADIALTAPNGSRISVNNPVASPNTNNTSFTFTLATGANSTGTYNLKIGPDILDLSGYKMNQDGDIFNGEATQDVYNGNFVNTINTINITNTRTVAIRDNTRATSQITINQNFNIRDLNVAINLTHTSRSDLIITIKSPWGQIVTLSNRRGGSGDHFSNTLFDDSATLSIASLSATGNGGGTYRSESSLSIFNGKNAKGIWTITVEDRATGNTGTLNSWKLNFQTDTVVAGSNLTNPDGGTVSASVSSAKVAGSILQSNVSFATSNSSIQSASLKTSGQPVVTLIPNAVNLLNQMGNATVVQASSVGNQQNRTDALFSSGNPFSLFSF